MPTYVSLMKWTEKGIGAVKETTKRADAARAAARRLGGKLNTILYTQGSYDAIAITEFPDEDSAMAFLLGTGMQGNVRTETLRAFTPAEMERIFGKMGDGTGAAGGASKAGAATKR